MNPLFKKFVQEGENPSTYIPADKRREIYEFMGKTNYTKGVLGKSLSDKSYSLILNQLSFCIAPKMLSTISTKKEADQKLLGIAGEFKSKKEAGDVNKDKQAKPLISFGKSIDSL